MVDLLNDLAPLHAQRRQCSVIETHTGSLENRLGSLATPEKTLNPKHPGVPLHGKLSKLWHLPENIASVEHGARYF